MGIEGDDYVSSAVSLDDRRPWINILVVWLGFIIVVGIMAVGGGMASQMPRADFITAVIFGNIILAMFAMLSGFIGAESGKNFNQLMSDVFPGVSQRIVSLYVPIILIGWFGVEAAIFGNLIGEIYDLSSTARRVLMFASTLMFSFTSYLGFRAMRHVSIIAVPLILAIGLYALYVASGQASNAFAFGDATLSVSQGMAIVMGSWIMGVLTCLPDLTRFSKARLSGALVGALGILIGNNFSFLVGGAAAVLAGEADPAKVLIAFGFIPLAVILALANIWTTNDNNMYSAALNVARLGNISRRKAVMICTVIAAVFAAFDPTSISVLFTFLLFMGNTAPALGGVVLGSYLWKRSFGNRKQNPLGAWIGWGMGSLAGTWFGGIFAVPTGFLIGFLVWLIIRTIAPSKNCLKQSDASFS